VKTPAPALPRLPSVCFTLLITILAAELSAFIWNARLHQAWIYPRWTDQSQYLKEAYGAYETAQISGVSQGIHQVFANHSPQGTLHGLFGIGLFAIIGPSRLAALSLNGVAFVVLQAALFFALRHISRRNAIAFASLGLIAAISFPWSEVPGSAIDFRLDWMATCAYGTALAFAILSDGFKSLKWSLLFGFAVGFTVLLRFICAVYFGLAIIPLLLWMFARREHRIQAVRLLVSACVALTISGPFLWVSRKSIFSYYWISQIVSPGIQAHSPSVRFFPSLATLFKELFAGQLGPYALIIGSGTAFALLGIRNQSLKDPTDVLEDWPAVHFAWTLAGLFFMAPFAVLAIHPIKDAQHLSILIPSLVVMAVLTWSHIAQGISRDALNRVSAGVFLSGTAIFVVAQINNKPSDDNGKAFRQINGLSDFLFFRAQELGLKAPSISETRYTDALSADSLEVLGYERHHKLIQYHSMFADASLVPTREAVFQNLVDSDFVLIVTGHPPISPLDETMERLRPEIQSWCSTELKYDGDVKTPSFSVSVYERSQSSDLIGGNSVLLDAAIASAIHTPVYSDSPLPLAPQFSTELRCLASTQSELDFTLNAAHSPISYYSSDLPVSLELNPKTGRIRGYLRHAGSATATIIATNASGSTTGHLSINVGNEPTFSEVFAPAACVVGKPVVISFSAFDASGTLNFVEVTDLSDNRMLKRITPPSDSLRNWNGTYLVKFDRVGKHDILLRTVCFDPQKRVYTFNDRECTIEASR
jgi:hypothetical protein